MKDAQILVLTIVVTVLMLAGLSFGLSRSGQEQPTASQNQPPALLRGENPHVKGATEASITIVEFSDFQCPSCKAADPLVKKIVAANPETVEVVYRHFPLDNIHPLARLAAQASEVAAEEGKFWEYHDKLFEKQEEWSSLGSLDEAEEVFANYAQELEIDKAKFLERISATEIKDRVQEDAKLARQIAVDSTPTFYVNGSPVAAPGLLESAVSELVSTQRSNTASSSGELQASESAQPE